MDNRRAEPRAAPGRLATGNLTFAVTIPQGHEAALPCSYGKYELLEQIGRGGMAEVFKARLPGIAGFEKTLVIKRLHPRYGSSPGFVQMFIDEAKLAAHVQHKNVVQVFELGSLDNGELFIAMEFVDGVDLKDLMVSSRRAKRPLPVWFALHALIEVLDALGFAHDLVDDVGQRRNIVHNDVTPENIFIARHGDVKLGDFGVAHDDTRTSDPFPGQIKGKVPYMSPEQLSGVKPDARSDVFAAAIVLWEVLTGRRLFQAPTQSETMARICSAPRPPPSKFNPDVPPELDAVVLAGLQIERDERIPSARAMQDDLHDVLVRVRGRVDVADVRKVVSAALGPGATPAPEPDYAADLEAFDEEEDEFDEPDVEAPKMSAEEAALHLASPSATGELPKMPAPRPDPVDVIKVPPPLLPPVGEPMRTPPPRRPPPRPRPRPRPVTGMVKSTGSIKDGFTYTIVHPTHGTDDVTTTQPPVERRAAELGEVDGLFRQFLAEKFAEDRQDNLRTSGPVRRMLSAAREIAIRPHDKTPLPALDASHPFWVRFPDGREVGPLDPPVLLRYLASRPYEDARHALITADQLRWVSTARLVTLLSEEFISNDPEMGQCTFLGTLRGHSLTAVLGELARTRATGRLVLYREVEHGAADRRELHIEEGALTAVSQNSATFAMWESLLTSPFFSQHHLPESVYAAIRIQRPITALLAPDAAAGLAQARGLMARRQLREIYKWDHAHFGFDPGALPLGGRPTPLLRLLPRMVSRSLSTAQLRRAVDRYIDTPLERAPDFDAEVAAMEFHATELERIEPLGHGYTLGESLAQSAPSADDRYALVISYVLLEVGLLKPERHTPSLWTAAPR